MKPYKKMKHPAVTNDLHREVAELRQRVEELETRPAVIMQPQPIMPPWEAPNVWPNPAWVPTVFGPYYGDPGGLRVTCAGVGTDAAGCPTSMNSVIRDFRITEFQPSIN